MPAPLKNLNVTDSGTGTAQKTVTPRSVPKPEQQPQQNTVKPLSLKRQQVDQQMGRREIANAQEAARPKLERVTETMAARQQETPAQPQITKPQILSKPGVVKPNQTPTRSVTELYQTATNGVVQSDTGLPRHNTLLDNARNELVLMERDLINPLWSQYETARTAYENGTGSFDALQSAKRTYDNARSRYAPYYDAYERLRNSDASSYWDTGDFETLAGKLSDWDSLLEEGNRSLQSMEGHINGLQSTFDSAAERLNQTAADLDAAYKALQTAEKAFKNKKTSADKYQATWEQYQSALEAFNSSREAYMTADDNLSAAMGDYKAEMLMLGDLSEMRKTGGETYWKRYIEANPQVVWDAEMGLGEENNTDFMSMLNHVDKLRADNTDGKNDDEIAYYYAVLNSGLAFANLTTETAAQAKQFFDDRIADLDAQIAEYDWVLELEDMINRAGRLPADQMAQYEAGKAERDKLVGERNEAQSWISKIETREYEMTYDEVLAGLSDKAQELIDKYITIIADPGAVVGEQYANAGEDLAAYEALRIGNWQASGAVGVDPQNVANLAAATIDTTQTTEALRESLKAEGLTDRQIDGILYYVNYEANARRAENLASGLYEESTELAKEHFWLASAINNLTQVTLGIGGTLGAVANIGDYVTRRNSRRELVERADASHAAVYENVSPDPYFYKKAPVDYNSFANLGTIFERTISQAEAKAIEEFVVDKNADDATQQAQRKQAQFWTNVYGLAVSMEQSVAMQLLHGMGMKGSLWLLSGNAAANTMMDLHEQGYSDEGAILGGIVAGFAEYITEEISLEGVLNRFQSGIKAGMSANEIAQALGKNVLLQAISEGSEEVASNLLNTLYDTTVGQLMNGGLTQIEMNALALQQEKPSMSWDEAYHSAFVDWIKELGQDFIGGMASGGLMGGGAYGLGYASGTKNAFRTGLQIINSPAGDNSYSLYDRAKAFVEQFPVAAKASGADLSRGTDTAIRAGRLLNYLTGEEFNTYRVIEERLKALNESDEKITPALLRAIADAATGQHLTPAERTALSNSQYGQQVANELERYKAEMERAEKNNMEPYLAEDEAWAQGAFEADEESRFVFTQAAPGNATTTIGAMNQQARYEDAQANNPDAAILSPISEQIVKEGASPEVADKQGKLLDKVFSGEFLSAKDMRALDLNNAAVRRVFVERSGMIGIPDRAMSNGLKQTYVNEVSRQSARIRENQQALREGSEQLAEVQRQKSEERTKKMKAMADKVRNPLVRIMDSTTGRRHKVNATKAEYRENRAAQRAAETKARTAEAQRNNPIDIIDKNSEQVIKEVCAQAGVDVGKVPLWADFYDRYNEVFADHSTEEARAESDLEAQAQYKKELQKLGFTRAEADAIANSQFNETRLTDFAEGEYTEEAEAPKTFREAKSNHYWLLDKLQTGDTVYLDGSDTPVLRVTDAGENGLTIEVLNPDGSVVGTETLVPGQNTDGVVGGILDKANAFRVLAEDGHVRLDFTRGNTTSTTTAKEEEQNGRREETPAAEEEQRVEEPAGEEQRSEEPAGEETNTEGLSSGAERDAGLGTAGGDSGPVLTSARTLLGSDAFTEEGNLSIVPVEEIITEDGKPGSREGLFHIREYLTLLGVPAEDITFVDGYGEHPVIQKYNKDGTRQGQFGNYSVKDGKITLVANNPGNNDRFNPIKTGVHEGGHWLFGHVQGLWNKMLNALTAAGYDELIVNAAEQYTTGNYGRAYGTKLTKSHVEEVINDILAQKIRPEAKGLGLELARDTVLRVIEENVPGFDRAAYDELMRTAERLYPDPAVVEAAQSEAETEKAHEEIDKGNWAAPFADISKLRIVPSAPIETQSSTAEQSAPAQTEAEEPKPAKPERKKAEKPKPKTLAEKVPEEFRKNLTTDEYLHQQLGDPDAKIVDEGNVRKLAATPQETTAFDYMLNESGANFVFVNTAGAENSKQYFTNGSPTSRLRGAVSYITVQKGDTMRDILIRMRQGWFDQVNRVLSKANPMYSGLTSAFNNSLMQRGAGLTSIADIYHRALELYEQRAWDLGILYDVSYETTNPNNPWLSEEDKEYAERVATYQVDEDDEYANPVIGVAYDWTKADAMNSKFRAWAMYQFYRDVFSGAIEGVDPEFANALRGFVSSEKFQKAIRPTWDFQRRLDEENARREQYRTEWLRGNTFTQRKSDLNPLSKADKATVKNALKAAMARAKTVQNLLEEDARLQQRIEDLSYTLARLEEGESPEFLFDVIDEIEDYMEDPRFLQLLDRACIAKGITLEERWANDPNVQQLSEEEKGKYRYDFDFQERYTEAWNDAVRAYNEGLSEMRNRRSGKNADWVLLYDPDAPPAGSNTTANSNAQTQPSGLSAEDQANASKLRQELNHLRGERTRIKHRLVEARSAAEAIRNQYLEKLTKVPYRTLLSQYFDDVLEGRRTGDEAYNLILGVSAKVQANHNLTVADVYGGTLTTNYYTGTKRYSLVEYKAAEKQAKEELKAAQDEHYSDIAEEDFTAPSERERNASVLAKGDAEKADQIRAEEQEKRNQKRREADLKAIDEAKREAGKTDSDASETTTTDIRNNLLDELDAAEADLTNAPVGYSENVRRASSMSKRAAEYLAKHNKRLWNSKETQTIQEGTAVYEGTENLNKTEQTRKDVVLDRIKNAGNTWMYLTFSDCWGLERFGMKQTRTDGVRPRINLLRASNETTQYIYTTALVDREGNQIGSSMKDVMLCWDETGKNVDTEKQSILQKYLLLLHTVDRMSVEQRALQAVIDFEELHPELRNISPGSIGRLIVERNNPIAKEYYRLLQWEEGAVNKPVLAVMTGTDGEKVKFADMNAVTAQNLADQLLAENPWLAEKSQGVYDWWDMFMREWGVGGRMSSEDYDNMRNAYPHYIPTYRAGDDRFIGSSSFRGASEISTGPVIHAAKGSTLEVLPFEDQFAMLASQYVQGARANELAWNFMQELLLSGEANDSDFSEFGQIDYDRTAEEFINERIEDDPDPMSQMIEHDDAKHEYRVNCWVDGKRVSAYVSKDIYLSFQNLLKKQGEWYKRLMSYGNTLTSWMKTFITGSNPSFALRNLAADLPTAAINSIVGYRFGKYWVDAVEHIARDSDEWNQFQALGGTHSNITNPRKGFATESTKKENAIKKAFEVAGIPGEFTESVTRFAEYLATLGTVGDDMNGRMNGIYNAAEVTVDFGRGGYMSRFMNAWSPYFNPAVQGIYKVVRGVIENKGMERAKYLARVAGTTMPVEILLYLIRAWAKREKDFEEESDYLKDNYYLIPLGGESGHSWLKIRKNREWAALFGNYLMRSLEKKNGYDDPYGTWLDISIKGNFLPDMPVPIFVQWVIDAATNKNFAGSTIVPSTFDDFKESRPMDVYDDETSVLAYNIARVSSKIFKETNPMFVDYILDYYMGDFWSNLYTWLDMGLLEEVQEEDGSKTLAIAKGAWEMIPSIGKELKNDWVTSSLYSNSTMTRYYDRVKKLRADTSAEKYQNGAATGSLEEQMYAALYYTDLGYASQITALAKQARGMEEGPEKDAIKNQQILLAHAAMEFLDRCESGEISDPVRYVRYSNLSMDVADELIRLSDFDNQFEYEPSFSRVSALNDPDNKGYQFMLSDEQKNEYVDLWRRTYDEMVSAMMKNSNYTLAPDGVKAQMLAQKRSEVRTATNEEFLKLLKEQGTKSTKKTLEDVEILQLEAQYALARANDPSTAISSEVSDELVRLRNYGSDYNFVLSTSVPKTFSRSSSSDTVYVLNDRQKDYYNRLRSSRYNEAMESILLSDEYKKRNDEGKAAMLQATAQLVSKQLKEEFDKWLTEQTDTQIKPRADMSQGALEQDAEFAVTRVLLPKDAYSREVTDELVRLYGYTDAYSFQPSVYRPSGYDDPDKKGYRFYLTEEQKDEYQRIAHNVYDAGFKTLMNSSTYRNAKNDEERAKLLDSMRGQLSDEVKEQFLAWLKKHAKSTAKPDNSAQKDLDALVKKIVGW